MSDLDRGAYAPPTEASLSFDPREPVRGSRPIPFTLIISILVLVGLGVAIFMFYQSGVRRAGQPPQAVGAPLSNIKAPPPPEAQPQDPAAGLQIYQAENGPPAPSKGVQFAPLPEQPQARAQPGAAPASAPPLRPAIAAEPPAAAHPTASIAAAPIARAAPPPAAATAPAPKVEVPAARTPPAKPAPVTAKPVTAKPVAGVASVQIGAFSSQALADKGWSDATAVAPGAAAGKGKSVEKVEKDGHTFFRTQVTGFASRADAGAFCAKLKAAGKACFVK